MRSSAFPIPLGIRFHPDALKHFWSGHAPKHVSERYTKLLGERQYRLDWAERIGMGFSVGLPGLLKVVPKVA